MNKLKNKFLQFEHFSLICILAYLLIFILSPSSTLAQTMSNSDYIIKMGNLNSGAGISTGSNFRLNQTLGQTGANLFTGANYKVRAGFQYVLSVITFRFSVSNTFVDFGTLTPGTPVLRTSLLTISNGSANGYQITVSQNHNLRVNASGQEIPPTSCDGGSCTPTTAGVWNNPTTYGFGYNCTNVSGTDCSSDFSGPTYYRPFISSPSAAVVMSSTNVGTNKQGTITYQLNVSNTQAAGLYTNILNYIATPTF